MQMNEEKLAQEYMAWLDSEESKIVKVDLSILELITIYGNIQYALRMPDNAGPTSEVARTLLERIDDIFQSQGMPSEVMDYIRQDQEDAEAETLYQATQLLVKLSGWDDEDFGYGSNDDVEFIPYQQDLAENGIGEYEDNCSCPACKGYEEE
jgi:hypothetical protein